MKHIRTRRGPSSLSAYRLLNVRDFLSASSTGRFATFSRVAFVGGLLLTLISPTKSACGSTAIVGWRNEVAVSYRKTKGTKKIITATVSRRGTRKAGLKSTEMVTAGERKARSLEAGTSAHQFCGGSDPPEAKWAIIASGGPDMRG